MLLNERKKVSGVFTALLHFGELIDQRMDLVAGKFKVLCHCQHFKHGFGGHSRFCFFSEKAFQPCQDTIHHGFDIHPLRLLTKQIEQVAGVEAFPFEAAFESQARIVHHFVDGISVGFQTEGDFIHGNAFETDRRHHGALTRG